MNFLTDYESGKIIVNENNRDYIMSEVQHSKKQVIESDYEFEIAQTTIMQKVLRTFEFQNRINNSIEPEDAFSMTSEEFQHLKSSNFFFEAMFFVMSLLFGTDRTVENMRENMR